jgi:hypothetical protein
MRSRVGRRKRRAMRGMKNFKSEIEGGDVALRGSSNGEKIHDAGLAEGEKSEDKVLEVALAPLRPSEPERLLGGFGGRVGDGRVFGEAGASAAGGALGAGRCFFGEEGFHKGFVKGENFGEVFGFVIFAFAEDAVLDEVEDDGTEVLAAGDAPFVEDCFAHGAEFFEGVLAEAFEQFGAGDVAGDGALGAFVKFEGVIQALTDEAVGLGVETGVGFDDFSDYLIEIVLLHNLDLF